MTFQPTEPHQAGTRLFILSEWLLDRWIDGRMNEWLREGGNKLLAPQWACVGTCSETYLHTSPPFPPPQTRGATALCASPWPP